LQIKKKILNDIPFKLCFTIYYLKKEAFIFRMIAINKYNVPIPTSSLQKIDTSPAHVLSLRNAIDFIAPQNTPVLAAADGIVTFVKDDSNFGGPYPSYWNSTNFITIEHSNGEYSRYDHLEYHSAKVRVGQKVNAGQEIAKIGMTGYTYIPHLHFQVFIFTAYNIFTDIDTLEVKTFI
jgi:murein DD-endopeptidase MepM/ murein hydrolase activator NlpD